MSKTKINRRQFLYTGAAASAGIALAACQPRSVIVEREKEVTKEVVVEKEVVKEVEVTKEVVVEKEVTVEVEVEKLITPTALPSNFSESPYATAMVAEGKLPSVDERRLPL